MTSAPPEPKLQPKNPGVEKPEGFFVKNSCIVRKSGNPHFGALLETVDKNGDGKISYSEFRVMMGAVPLVHCPDVIVILTLRGRRVTLIPDQK